MLPRITTRFALACACVSLIGIATVACGGRTVVDHGGGKPQPTDDTFADHTQKTIASRADFDKIAAPSNGSTAALFILSHYQDDTQRDVRFLDSKFYSLHDEWYWFRLLNGAHVPGVDDAPVDGLHFDTIADIYTWAHAQESLPLDLAFIGTRLYSARFYNLALFTPADAHSGKDEDIFGLGTLMHFDARPDANRAEIWAWQLEYQDDTVQAADIARFFDQLKGKIPDDIFAQLKWVVRSPAQEKLAEQMAATKAPYFDRIIRYSDLTIPGDVDVYNAGLTAGRLRVFHSGDAGLEDTAPTDIVVVEDTPDNLPLCAGFVTANPQTALAHVAVLAKARGVPNVYVAGVLDDPNLLQLAQVRAPVALRAVAATATAKAHVDLVPMTEAQFATYRALISTPDESVPQPDFSSMAYTVDLQEPTLADQESWRLIIGGKAMGLAALMDVPGVQVPDNPLAISTRGYHEHIASFLPQLQAMLADNAFTGSQQARLLVLEGEASYDQLFPTPADQRFKEDFLNEQPAGTTLGDIIRAGGVQGMITGKPIDAATMQTYLDALNAAYGDYAATEGLRFRSSSQVEDDEAFQGAGVGLSFTGFLHADQFPPTSPHHAETIETAIKNVWATYWRAEGFEERRLAGIDQLSANMGIAVHARSDNTAELANGDLFCTLDPPEVGDVFTMELDVQPGANPSVTNPNGSTALPEHDVVRQTPDGLVHIERTQHATLLPDGDVLSSDELQSMFAQCKAASQYYFGTENVGVPVAQQRRMITLDMEFRKMAAGWPALASGPNPQAERIIFRQSASLIPSMERIPSTVKARPIPLDILARAQRVEQRACTSTSFTFTAVDVFTNPALTPDLGYASAPFTSDFVLAATSDVPALDLHAGDRVTADHTQFAATHPGMSDGGPWDVDLTLAASTSPVVSHIAIDASGALTVDGVSDGATTCHRNVLYATPGDFLGDIIANASTTP